MKKFGAFRLFLLLILVLILSVIPQVAGLFYHKNLTKEGLFGIESEINGVLVVWNIDTFEGGKVSKSSIIEFSGKEFEKQNKGLFVLVKNITLDELMNAKSEDLPDIISFGSGVYDRVFGLICEGELAGGVFKNIEQSVMIDGCAAATPWCAGAYFVCATEESLSRAGKDNNNLIADCMTASFDKQIGRRKKHIYSLEMGSDSFHSEKLAVEKTLQFDGKAVDEMWSEQTYYEAYEKFVCGASTFLVGTQRDLARLENKKTQGAISDYFANMLGYSDLIQYISAVKSDNLEKLELAKSFCRFMLSDVVQQKVFDSGVFPVRAIEIDSTNEIFDKAYKNIENIEIEKIY